jgi:hypothetical protein
MDITPGLPGTDNFQHWPPWWAAGRRDRPARTRLHRRHPGDAHDRPARAVLARDQPVSPNTPSRYDTSSTADQETLRGRIKGEHAIPSPFRLQYLEPYAEAARTRELGAKA